MKPKLTHALAGLALALVLALFAVAPSGSSELKPDAIDGVSAADGRTEATTRLENAETPRTTAPPELLDEVELPPAESDASLPPEPEPEPQESTASVASAAPAAPADPVPAAAPAGSLEEIIHRHFGAAAPRAIQIARCESNMNPSAVSRTNDHGLFQINIVHQGNFQAVTGQPWSAVYDPEFNTIYAKHLYNSSGWGPWVCNRKV